MSPYSFFLVTQDYYGLKMLVRRTVHARSATRSPKSVLPTINSLPPAPEKLPGLGVPIFRVGEEIPQDAPISIQLVRESDFGTNLVRDKGEIQPDTVAHLYLGAYKHAYLALRESDTATKMYKHDFSERSAVRYRRFKLAHKFAGVAEALKAIQQAAAKHGQGKRLVLDLQRNPRKMLIYGDKQPLSDGAKKILARFDAPDPQVHSA